MDNVRIRSNSLLNKSLDPFLAPKNEVHYFGELAAFFARLYICQTYIIFILSDRNYQKGPDWYLEQLPAASYGQVVVEKTPRYFVESKIPQRIRSLLPDVKLIIVLRNPIDRLVSDWLQETDKK